MKTILCYGDSNTYGFNPHTCLRYKHDVRWTGRLQKLLGEDFTVIEEGCNGRTTCFEEPLEPWKKGSSYLKPCLNTHKPIDLVIMMLGSNDLKTVFNATAEEVAENYESLVVDIEEFTALKQGFVPKILVMAPPIIKDNVENSLFFGNQFDKESIKKSYMLPALYEDIAKRHGCFYLNTQKYIEPSERDSLHLEPEAHEKLAEVIFEEVKKIL